MRARRLFHRSLWLVLLILALATASAGLFAPGIAGPVWAAPAALDCRLAVITAPVPGAKVSGVVEVIGRAAFPDLRFYKVEYSPVAREQWALIGTDVITRKVDNGRLVLWQTATLPEGAYRLRLRAVDPSGNYCESTVTPINVLIATPTAMPSPTPSETPLLTVVPSQATPTLPARISVEFSPAKTTPGSLPARGLGPTSAPDFNPGALIAFFVFGALVTFSIVVFVAIVMFVRRFG